MGHMTSRRYDYDHLVIDRHILKDISLEGILDHKTNTVVTAPHTIIFRKIYERGNKLGGQRLLMEEISLCRSYQRK